MVVPCPRKQLIFTFITGKFQVKRVQIVPYPDALKAIGVVTGNELGFALQVIVRLHTDTAGGQVLHFLFDRVLNECHSINARVNVLILL